VAGIGLASVFDVLHVVDTGFARPVAAGHPWTALLPSATLHVAFAVAVGTLPRSTPPVPGVDSPEANPSPVEIRHVVFIAPNPNPTGGGGGGGGNRQQGPIRHAESVGSDAITLRVGKPISTTGLVTTVATPPQLVLDALPLASGNFEQFGLSVGGVSFGTSTGPGSGGGVGTGIGTGIGPGRGPGIGPGEGGGIGGGVYRPGGSVMPPRVLTEVKPTYTSEALLEKIQGTVVVELVVRATGHPSDIRIVQSLDPGGLDEQATVAVSQWRFEPGRLAGKPVDVLVTVMLDFWIR
jgi:TonB family protein